jgi:hypothetical protein
MSLFVYPPVNVSITGVATEATLQAVKTAVNSIDTKLDSVATQTTVNDIKTIIDGRLSGSLVPKAFDAIVPTFGATTDAYAYYTGGTGGTLLKTVTITYTDSTKSVIQSIISA